MKARQRGCNAGILRDSIWIAAAVPTSLLVFHGELRMCLHYVCQCATSQKLGTHATVSLGCLPRSSKTLWLVQHCMASAQQPPSKFPAESDRYSHLPKVIGFADAIWLKRLALWGFTKFDLMRMLLRRLCVTSIRIRSKAQPEP